MKKLPFWVWLFSALIIVHHCFALPEGWFDRSNVLMSLVLLALLWIMGWLAVRYSSAGKLLYNFIFPMILGIATLILGTFAFHATEIANYKTWGDSFFGAANLITLNASELNDIAGRQPILIAARTLGGLTAIYAFILAFSLAAGRESMDRLKFWLFRNSKWFWKSKSFIVVIGEGDKALHLALNLEQENNLAWGNSRIVLMRSQFVELLRDKDIWLITGNLTNQKDLCKTYFWLAREVFVISEEDDENFRIAHELNRVSKPVTEATQQQVKPERAKKGKWYIHQSELQRRELLQQLSPDYDSAFSIRENMARKLLATYPFYRFEANKDYDRDKSACLLVLGFNAMAQELVLQFLRLGHFEKEKNIFIKVFHLREEQPAVDRFKEKYPFLFTNNLSEDNGEMLNSYRYAFPRLDKRQDVVQFDKLPISESGLSNIDWDLYNYVVPDRVTSIYICQDNGVHSTALLSSIIERIKYLKFAKPGTSCDVRVFCQYKYSELDEMKIIGETLINRHEGIFMGFFGNILEECKAETIRSEEQDELAKKIALLFNVIYLEGEGRKLQGEDNQPIKINGREFELKKENEVSRTIGFVEFCRNGQDNKSLNKYKDEIWNKTSENHQASNRHAADHANIKRKIKIKNGESALDVFKQLVREIWTQEFATDADRYRHFFHELNEKNIPNLAEIEHRRWVAVNLLDGFSLLKDSEEDKKLWADNEKALKVQKIHADLVPFDKLGWELIENQDPWVTKSKDISGVYGIS